MAGKFTLDGRNAVIAVDLLKIVAATLQRHQVRFALDGGTLLGIVREGRLLPWDNDMDLVAPGGQGARIRAALADLAQAGFQTSRAPFKDDYGPLKQGRLRIAKVRSGEVCVDIIVKYPDAAHYYWVVAGKQIKKRVDRRFYDRFDMIDFAGARFPIPADVGDYLTARYGDWRTPVQAYDYRTDDGAIIPDAPIGA